LRERLQAGVAAVQQAPGVAHQSVAGDLQQPLPGFGVARHGPLQLPLQDGGRFVAHGPRSLLSGRRGLLVTLTTVGYGDKVPVTVGGKLAAGCTMIAGLGVFATFISLMGIAFLEEVREAMQRRAAAKRALPAMSPTDFDPQEVLQALHAGRLRRAD